MKSHWLVRYGAAVLVVLLAIAALSLPHIGRALISVLFLAVLFAAWFGGIGPGLFATSLITTIAILHLLFVEPELKYWRLVWVGLFVPCGVLVSVLTEATHAARRRVTESQQWLSAVLTSIGDAVIATDSRGSITFLNPVAESLTGWTFEDAMGRPLAEVFRVVQAESRRPIDNPANRVVRDDCVIDLASHSILIARNGTEIPIGDSAAPIKDKTGAITGVVIVFRDTTLREHIENVQARLASIVEFSSDAIISHNLDGTITSWNSGAERLFGYTANEMIDRSTYELIPPDRHAVEADLSDRLSQGQSVQGFESIRLTNDGRRIDVSLTISPIIDRTGRIVAASTIARDISDRKRLEHELNTRVDELAEGNRHRDEFLAMLAHELRNPLAAIHSAVDLTKISGLPEQTAVPMEIVDRQLNHLARMVDDLLDVSRITRGRITLKKQSLKLSTALESAITATRPLFESRQHQLSVEMASSDLSVEADPVRLEQIVTNLIANAAKYTQPGGRVWLSAHREQFSVVINIRDNGIGIAPDQIDKMFDLFAQGNRSLARSEGGLGVGLTVARSLTELHGGTLVASSPGLNQGSQFTVTLPAASPAPVAPEAPVPRAPHPENNVRKGGSRVMIIDDNIDLARGMAGLLTRWNHQVWVAYDGPSGLEAVRNHRPEVVLLDIGLPGMDGYEVADLLRREEFGKNVLLIAVTGYGQEEDRQHAFSAGFDHFVTKPVDYPTLLALMVGNSPAQS